MPHPLRPVAVTLWVPALLITCFLTACGQDLPDPAEIDTQEKAAQATLDCMEHATQTLGKIDDMASFEKHKADLEAAFTTMMEIADKAEHLGELPADERQVIADKYKQQQIELYQRIVDIAHEHHDQPELVQAITDTINNAIGNSSIVQRHNAQQQAEIEAIYQQSVNDHNQPAGTHATGSEQTGSNLSPESYPADPIQPVTIVVEDVSTAAQRASVQRELTRIAQGKPVAPVSYQNRTATFTVGLVVDPAAFANQLTFGQVRSVDVATRTITVRYTE